VKVNKLHVGNNIDVLKTFPDNCIDSIITDPPYGLVSITKRFGKESSAPAKQGKDGSFARLSKGFMGQEWDGSGIEYSVELWSECLRVAKPGAILMAFGGTRTYHRIATAIEDAGWEIRDMITWNYGCLSEDTEILTSNGWERYHKNLDKKQIVCYNIEKDSFELHLPERLFFYENKHPAYRIKSDITDQLVSRNHRVIVEREGKLVFVEAQELHGMETVPTLQKDFSFLQEKQSEILFNTVQRILSRTGLEKIWSSWRTNIESSRKQLQESKLRKQESCMEGGSDILQEKGKLSKSINQIREMPSRVYKYVKKRWLRDGTQAIGSNGVEQAIDEGRNCSPHQPQCGRQQTRKLNAIQKQLRTQEIRTRSGYTTTLATVEEVEYIGNVWCVQVPTGAFVARRNGMVFITGNSGFPKSLDLSKSIDKKLGVEREVVATREVHDIRSNNYMRARYDEEPNTMKYEETVATSELAKLWDGWKTAMKPSLEPIVVARKPLDGTNVDNALKWSVCGFNIDDSRIGVEERYPANTILGCYCEGDAHDEDCPIRIMDEQSKGASRFFYCAKASKAERNAGLENLVAKQKIFNGKSASSSSDMKDVEARFTTKPQANIHPTVKPLKLMEYLCTLTKTPTGGVVLDPFAGSGTTLVASVNTGRDFVGIELSPEYAEIANARIEHAIKNKQEMLF
jgi:DNA modification methylase